MQYYPLYRFGYGKSYTQFEYSNLQTKINGDSSITIMVNVTNTGNRAGDEVVQLYLPDMYASVKTRVMELKDFVRVSLQPGEQASPTFTITPYQLSLLNDRMDRVVEQGDLKISIGGSSPTYRAGDRIKESVGYSDASQGISETIGYPFNLSADFDVEFLRTEEQVATGERKLFVRVTNRGNLMDTGKLYLYADGKRTDEVHHYELGAGEGKIISFTLPHDAVTSLAVATKYRLLDIDL
jgi:beta-glucosidase